MVEVKFDEHWKNQRMIQFFTNLLCLFIPKFPHHFSLLFSYMYNSISQIGESLLQIYVGCAEIGS